MPCAYCTCRTLHLHNVRDTHLGIHARRRMTKEKAPVGKVLQDLTRGARHIWLPTTSRSEKSPCLTIRLQQLLWRKQGMPFHVFCIILLERELNGVRELQYMSRYAPRNQGNGRHHVAHVHDRENTCTDHLRGTERRQARAQERSTFDIDGGICGLQGQGSKRRYELYLDRCTVR